jgi:hypothetical protein
VLPHLAGLIEKSAITHRGLPRIVNNYHEKDRGVKKVTELSVFVAGSLFYGGKLISKGDK